MPEDFGVSLPGSLQLLDSQAVHSLLEWHIFEPFVGLDKQWVVAGRSAHEPFFCADILRK